MCLNTVKEPTNQINTFFKECIDLKVPEYPGQVNNCSTVIGDYTVSMTVEHDVNCPRAIHVSIAKGFHILWHNNHTFSSVPEALEKFSACVAENIKMAINWVQNH